jgi:hypothetical protein
MVSDMLIYPSPAVQKLINDWKGQINGGGGSIGPLPISRPGGGIGIPGFGNLGATGGAIGKSFKPLEIPVCPHCKLKITPPWSPFPPVKDLLHPDRLAKDLLKWKVSLECNY